MRPEFPEYQNKINMFQERKATDQYLSLTQMEKSSTNIHKLNTSMFEKIYIPQSNDPYSKCARLVQYFQMNLSNPLFNNNKKLHDRINWCRNSVWKSPTPITIKAQSKPGIDGNFLDLLKNVYKKQRADIILDGEKLNVFTLNEE